MYPYSSSIYSGIPHQSLRGNTTTVLPVPPFGVGLAYRPVSTPSYFPPPPTNTTTPARFHFSARQQQLGGFSLLPVPVVPTNSYYSYGAVSMMAAPSFMGMPISAAFLPTPVTLHTPAFPGVVLTFYTLPPAPKVAASFSRFQQPKPTNNPTYVTIAPQCLASAAPFHTTRGGIYNPSTAVTTIPQKAPKATNMVGAQCGHHQHWKRLRSKKGYAFYACLACELRWKVPTANFDYATRNTLTVPKEVPATALTTPAGDPVSRHSRELSSRYYYSTGGEEFNPTLVLVFAPERNLSLLLGGTSPAPVVVGNNAAVNESPAGAQPTTTTSPVDQPFIVPKGGSNADKVECCYYSPFRTPSFDLQSLLLRTLLPTSDV